MSELTIETLDLQILENFNVILQEMTDLIVTENAFLSVTSDPPPKPLLDKKELLSARYAAVTVKLRKRTHALHIAGKLDPDVMEKRIRHLVSTVKENQTLLNARKVATAQRVETVMQALADRERKASFRYNANGNKVAGNVTPLNAYQVRI